LKKFLRSLFGVVNMMESVRFYRDVLGMELLYGGEDAGFSSLRAKDAQSAILNLEQGDTVTRWGRLVFHVTDVDGLWTYLNERGFDPAIPRRFLGRTLFPHARSRRPPVVVCASATMTRGELRSAARRNDRDPQLIASLLARTLGDGSQGELRAEYSDPIFLVVLVPSLL
jgi:catechol 2,3-dioxygenase-like lactoylglutathione lyase family enzyme